MRKYSPVIILLVVLLVFGGAIALWLHAPTDSSAGQRNDDQKLGNKKPENEEMNGSFSNPQVSLTLNNFGQHDDGTVYANAVVNNTTKDTCEFVFTYDDSNVVRTTDIKRTPTDYYACGIRIDNSEFTPKGEWHIHVSLPDTEPLAISETKEAVIR